MMENIMKFYYLKGAEHRPLFLRLENPRGHHADVPFVGIYSGLSNEVHQARLHPSKILKTSIEVGVFLGTVGNSGSLDS